MTTSMFLIALFKIVWIDVVLSGDNALVIAIACRDLPKEYKTIGMVLGAAAAVALRVAITTCVMALLGAPYVQFAGGVFLAWIAMKMLTDEGSDEIKSKSGGELLLAAIVTVMIADISMSIDNVVAVAAAADGDATLIGIGLALSIPFVVFGASMIQRLLERAPILIWLAGALLGYISGETILSDPLWLKLFAVDFSPSDVMIAGALGAIIVPTISFAIREMIYA